MVAVLRAISLPRATGRHAVRCALRRRTDGRRAYQGAAFVLLDGTDDQLRCLLRRGARELLEVERDLFRIDGVLVCGELEASIPGDVGADAAGVDGGGRDAALLDVEFGAQRVGEPSHRELGRVVGRLAGNAEEAEHTGDVDHVAVAGRLQMGEECHGAVHDAPEVDVHQPAEAVVRHCIDVGRQRNPGVVEDQVDLAELLDGQRGPRFDRVAFGDVDMRGCQLHVAAEASRSFDHRNGLGECSVVDVAQRKVGSPMGQYERNSPPDAGTGTRDRRDFAFEVLHGVDSTDPAVRGRNG